MFALQVKKMIRSKSFAVAVLFTVLLYAAAAVLQIYGVYGAATAELSPAWLSYLEGNAPITVLNLHLLFFMPLSAGMLCSAAYRDDLSSGIVPVLFTRQSKRRYWGQGILLSFLSAFLLTLFAMALCQALLCLVFPLNSMRLQPHYPTFYAEEALTRSMLFWKELAVSHPYLYLFIYDLLPAAFAGLVSVAVYALGMLLHKRVLVVFLPGLLIVALNFFLEFAGKSSYCPYHVLQSGMRFHGIQPHHLLTVFLAALAVDAVLLTAGFIKNRDVLPSA